MESIGSNTRHAVGNFYASKGCAAGERTISDTRHAVGDNYTCQPAATVERTVSDGRHGIPVDLFGDDNISPFLVARCDNGSVVRNFVVDLFHFHFLL